MALITLTSDIGVHDFMPGAIKGQLLKENPGFNIIDISHLLSPFNYPQAAYVCRNTIFNFPEGSFHLVMVNLFDQKPSYLLLVEHNGQYIGCADNGLITMILEDKPQKVIALPLDPGKQKNTLYLVSVFAKAFNSILQGKKTEDLGEIFTEHIKIQNPLRPLQGADWIEGHIIFIDNFENVVVNIHRDDFEEHRRGRRFSIVFKREEMIDKLSECYADVPEGEKLAMFNSAGYLEIAINKGNAAGLLGLQGYSDKQQQNTPLAAFNSRLFYQTVKIFFE